MPYLLTLLFKDLESFNLKRKKKKSKSLTCLYIEIDVVSCINYLS